MEIGCYNLHTSSSVWLRHKLPFKSKNKGGKNFEKNNCKVFISTNNIFSLTPAAMAISLGDRVLAVGSVGDDVAQLQQSLNTQGFWAGFVDGVFGELTKMPLWSIKVQIESMLMELQVEKHFRN